jgi:putative addiction module killer protein
LGAILSIAGLSRWFNTLHHDAQARVTVSLVRLERGNTSAAKSVGAGVFELSLNFGPGYPIYFGWDGERLVILLGGGSKKRQPTDIECAQALWREYKTRKPEEGCHSQKASTNPSKASCSRAKGFAVTWAVFPHSVCHSPGVRGADQ